MGKTKKEEGRRRGGAAASLRYLWWRKHQKQKVRGEMRQGKGHESREVVGREGNRRQRGRRGWCGKSFLSLCCFYWLMNKSVLASGLSEMGKAGVTNRKRRRE